MGITIVQKSDLKKVRPGAKKALILAGGAVTGGSFKAGGIKALNDYFVDFSVNDFDIFVGLSSGSMIAAALIGGISPESILKSLDGTSDRFTPLTAWHYYRPNVSELISRPIKFLIQTAGFIPGRLAELVESYPEWSRGVPDAIWKFIRNPTVAVYDEIMNAVAAALGRGDIPSLGGLLPSGVFDNRPIEIYFRENIERNKLTNDFKVARKMTGKGLYITAMRLDGASRAIFGPDEDSSLTISEAVQASTALPGFYKPAHIRGVDYVDGGIKDTANIDIAVKKGASLIVCYNPFRPYEAREFVEGFSKKRREEKPLAADGVMAVLNQIFRAFFHERLRVALAGFKQSGKFKGDIILIEPRADDMAFFALNPLSLKNRLEAARLGFESVRNSIDNHFNEIQKIMAAYGIKFSRTKVEEKFRRLTRKNLGDREVQKLLEGRKAKARLK